MTSEKSLNKSEIRLCHRYNQIMRLNGKIDVKFIEHTVTFVDVKIH